MPRVFTFRGKTAEEIKAMSNAEFAKLLNSRERRSMIRAGVQYRKLMQKVERIKKKDQKKVIKTHVREAVILPSWIGTRFAVYNGKEFKELEITAEMLGHRLGEFVIPVKRVLHSAPGIRATRGSKFLSVK